MMIVLDTNILVSDFNLTSSTFQVFLKGLNDAGHSLFTLQIVLDETVNKYKESLHKLKLDEEKLNRELRTLTNEAKTSIFSDEWVEQKTEDYRKYLVRTFKHFAEFNARLIQYPNTDHKVLVKKALLRKKPFSIKGTGYRDALIWENLLWISETYIGSEKLAFISKNTKDFSDDKQTLHSDLVNELEAKGIDNNTIVFYSTLEEFVKEQITSKYESLNLLKEQINQNLYANINFKNVLKESLEEVLPYSIKIKSQKDLTHDLPFEWEKLNIELLDNIVFYQIVDARRSNSMTKSDILLNIEIAAEAYLTGYLQKSNLDQLQKIPLLSTQEDDSNQLKISFKALLNFSIDSFLDEKTDETENMFLSGIGALNINNIKAMMPKS
jgi:predicted nucleic acid-binding protein